MTLTTREVGISDLVMTEADQPNHTEKSNACVTTAAIIATLALCTIAIAFSVFSCIGWSLMFLPSLILGVVSAVATATLLLLLARSSCFITQDTQELKTTQRLQDELSFLRLMNQGFSLDISQLQLQIQELKESNNKIKYKVLQLFKAATPPDSPSTPEYRSTLDRIKELFSY